MLPENKRKSYPPQASDNRSRSAKRSRKPKKSRGWLTFVVLLLLLAGSWKALSHFGFVPEALEVLEVTDQEKGRIIALHPEIRQKSEQLVSRASNRGIEVVITSGFRSSAEQDRLYRQGREDPGNIVTNARGGQSYHNFGLAIDFALRNASGNIVWDMEMDRSGSGRSDWLEVVDLAKEMGFDWGGDWSSFRDYPHLQMTFGYSLRQLQKGRYPAGSVVEPWEPESGSSE